MNAKTLLRAFGRGVKRNAPTILTATGIGGMVVTVVLACKATPEAVELLEGERRRKMRETYPDPRSYPLSDEQKDEIALSPVEAVKTVGRLYIPATVVGITSAACIMFANHLNLKRNAALMAAYQLSETAMKELSEKTLAEVGEKKFTEIKDAIAKDKMEEHPVSQSDILWTGHGDTLCFDTISGRYFHSTQEKIRQAINELNFQATRDECFISVNDFYDKINLPHIKVGYDLGWSIKAMGDLVEVGFSSQLAEDGTPCLVLDYLIEPEWYCWPENCPF